MIAQRPVRRYAFALIDVGVVIGMIGRSMGTDSGTSLVLFK